MEEEEKELLELGYCQECVDKYVADGGEILMSDMCNDCKSIALKSIFGA